MAKVVQQIILPASVTGIAFSRKGNRRAAESTEEDAEKTF
jgi:hypothetical protein